MCLPVTEVVINKIKVRRLRNGKEIPQELSIGENSTLSLNLNVRFHRSECSKRMKEERKQERKKEQDRKYLHSVIFLASSLCYCSAN